MPLGIPNPINTIKDFLREEWNPKGKPGLQDVPAGVWYSFFGESGLLGVKPPWPRGEGEPFLNQIREAKTKEQAQAVIDTYAGGEPLASDNMLKVLRDKGLLSRVMPGVANPGPGLSLDPNSDTGNAYLRVGAFQDVRGADPYNVYDTIIQDAFSSTPSLQLAYMRETDPLGVMPSLEKAFSENDEKHHNTIKDRLGRIVGGGGKSLLNVFGIFGRVEELLGQSYYRNKVTDPAMRHQMDTKYYDLAINPWDSNHTQEQAALAAIKEIDARELTGAEASAELEKYFKAHPLGLTSMFSDIMWSAALDPLWFFPLNKVIAAPIKAITGAPEASRIWRLLKPGVGAVKKAEKAKLVAAGIEGTFGWTQVTRMEEAAWASGIYQSAPKGVTRILTTQLPHLGAAQARETLAMHTASVADELFSNPEHVLDVAQSFIKGKPVGFVERRLPHLLEDPAMAQLHAVSVGNEEFLTNFAKFTNKTWETGEQTAVDALKEMIAKGGDVGVKAQKDLSTLLQHGLSDAAGQTMDSALRKVYNSTKFGRFLLQKHSPFVSAIRWPVMFVTINNPGFVYLNLVANLARHMWEAGRHPITGGTTFAKSFYYEFFRPGVSALEHPSAKLYASVGLDPFVTEMNVIRKAAVEQLIGHGGTQVAEDLTGKQFVELLSKQASQPIKAILQQPSMRRRFLDVLFAPTHIAGKMDLLTRRATFDLSLREQLHWGSSASWIKKAGIFPIAEWGEKRGMVTKDARLFEDKVVDAIHADMRKGVNLTEERLNAHMQEQFQHFVQGTEGKLYSVRNTAREFAESKGYSPEEAIAFTQDIADFNATIYDEVLVDGLSKVVRGELTPKQLKNMLDAHVLDYYTAADQIAAMGNVSSFWRPESTLQDALRMDERAMRDNFADVVNHLQRLRNSLSAYAKELKLTNREFHRLVGLNTVKNTEDLAAINQFIRDTIKVHGELPAEAKATLAKMYKEYFANRIERHNLLYEFEAADVGKYSSDHVENIITPWHESTLETFRTHDIRITKALAQGTDEAWNAAVISNKKMYEELATKNGQLFGHGVNDLPSAAKIMDATGPKAELINEYATYLYNDLRKNITQLRGAGKAGVGRFTVTTPNQKVSQQVGDFTVWSRQRLSGEVEIGFSAGVEANAEKFREARGTIADAFREAVGDNPGKQVVIEAYDPTKEGPLVQLLRDHGMEINGEGVVTVIGAPTLALAPKAALMPSELPGLAKDAYAHWSGAREQMISNAMAKTDFVMLNYNQQYGLDRVLQAFMPFVFWPSRDSAHWLIRVARQPGAAAALLAAMQAPKEYAEQYGYPQRLKYQIPIPMPGLDDMLHDLPIVRDLLADVNFGPVYWIDPVRFITPMADYRQSYSNAKKQGTPMGLIADWVENYTPLNINPFIKILGTETGLLDSDAWASTQFNGGPFGIPLTTTAQLADRWLRGGDLDAIPESEQFTYVNKGHFSIPFLNKALGLEPDAGDIWRAERSAWGLALQDKLLPGKPHAEQVRAAMEAVDTHRGVAWERALRSSTEESQLRQITAWIGFPFGGVTGVNEGEWVWMSLQQAYSAYAEKGQLDKFFEKYPEFEVRSAVVKGMDDPKEKQIAIDNELYHQDVDKLITKPYAASIEEIEGRLDQLAHLTQSTPVREQRQILLDELRDIRAQQSNMYDMLDKMYPNHIQELSLNQPPRERALKEVRDAWQAIRQQPGESWEEFRQRQEDFLSQFPPEEKGWQLQDWQGSYQAYLLTQIDYNLRTRKAADTGKWDDFDTIKQQREDRLTALHEQSMDGKLSRRAVESYLASWNYPKSPEQLEFDKAKSMMNMWMGLVGDGSMLTSREKGAVSDYFRAQPLIQKHYPLEVIPFEDLTINQRLDMMRRDEIWSTYYGMSTSENRLDYIRTVSDELNAINKRLGFPPLNVIDYEAPPPELGMGDPTIARLEMMSTAARKRALIDNAGEEELDEETLKSYEELLAVDPNDPSPLTSQGLDWHLRQFVDPNQK